VSELDWMREQLSRYSYRPGWTMALSPEAFGGATLVVRYPATDSRDPSRQSWFECRRLLGPYPHLDPEWFARDIQHVLFEAEKHESREWLRRDGEVFDDPHRDPGHHHCKGCGGVGPIKHEGDSWTCPGCHTKAESHPSEDA